ncbi:MAG: RNA polymerase factor sigma-32 [Holosporaceae bacterium]|jgi:RNA polymerase sigma-32 factor|nr:RNA polymerase factor sigma-32 [Holosporaceae bacterium]
MSAAFRHGSAIDGDLLTSYVSGIKKFPILGEDEEFELAVKWKEHGDKKALEKIVSSHLRLVMKIASGYAGYGLSKTDLIAEGNVGIMHALQHFDPSIGYRFSTYAAWWIKAKIREFIYNSWSIVRLGTGKNNRKLFFGLRKIKNLLGVKNLSEKDAEVIADKMNVTKEDVIISDIRLTHKDFSANSPIGDDQGRSWQDFLADTSASPESVALEKQEYTYRKKVLHDALNTLSKREYDILCSHRLHNPIKSLKEIAESIGLSTERVRQIEKDAFLKLQKYVRSVEWNTLEAVRAYGSL